MIAGIGDIHNIFHNQHRLRAGKFTVAVVNASDRQTHRHAFCNTCLTRSDLTYEFKRAISSGEQKASALHLKYQIQRMPHK